MAVLTSDQLRQLRKADERHRAALMRFTDSVCGDRCDYNLGREAFEAELDRDALMHKYGISDIEEIYAAVDAGLHAAPF